MYFNNRCNFNNERNENYNKDERKKNCCVKRTEEVFYCFPSYYNEEKKEDEKDFCWEGTFKICPKEEKHNNKCETKESNYSKNGSNNSCCFCNLFRNCRW